MNGYDLNITPGDGGADRRRDRGNPAALLLLAFFALSIFMSVLAFLTALIALCR